MRLICIALLIAAHLGCDGVSAQRGQPVSSDPAVKAFQDRVKAYMALRDKVDGTVPKLKETANPKEISVRERALGDALIKARMGVKPGDVFVRDFRAWLVPVIKADFSKRTAAERKALIVELPKGPVVAVNSHYPTTIPLATFPGNLLKVLPELPEQLEYRIVYRHLILRDVGGNYVVDVVENIIPTIPS